MIESENYFPKEKRNKYLIIIVGLTLINIIVWTFVMKTNISNEGGISHYMNESENFKFALYAFLISIPFVSLFLALLISLLPYKKLEYSKKYVRSSVLTLLTINVILSVGLVLLIIETLIGWYPPKKAASIITSEKKQLVSIYKSDMNSLCDSATFYLDLALSENETPGKRTHLLEVVIPKIKYFEKELNERSKAFIHEANSIKFTGADYETLANDMKQYMQPIQKKNMLLIAKGIQLK